MSIESRVKQQQQQLEQLEQQITRYAPTPRHVISYTLLVILAIIALMVWGGYAHGQQPQPQPQPGQQQQIPAQLAPAQPTEAQTDHIDLAIKDLQMIQSAQAQLQAQLQEQQSAQAQLQEQLRQKTDDVNARVIAVRKQLGLDDTWIYDFQSKKFGKSIPSIPRSAQTPPQSQSQPQPQSHPKPSTVTQPATSPTAASKK